MRTVRQEPAPALYFKKDLHFESIDVVDLLFELEQEFGVPFTMNEFNDYILSTLKNLSWDFTIEQLGSFVESKLA